MILKRGIGGGCKPSKRNRYDTHIGVTVLEEIRLDPEEEKRIVEAIQARRRQEQEAAAAEQRKRDEWLAKYNALKEKLPPAGTVIPMDGAALYIQDGEGHDGVFCFFQLRVSTLLSEDPKYYLATAGRGGVKVIPIKASKDAMWKEDPMAFERRLIMRPKAKAIRIMGQTATGKALHCELVP